MRPHLILSLSGASDAAIKRAYRQLVRKYHPDKNTDPDAEQRFLDIVEAYEVLSDPELRAVYDEGQDIADYMERRRRQQQGAGPGASSNAPPPAEPPPSAEVCSNGEGRAKDAVSRALLSVGH